MCEVFNPKTGHLIKTYGMTKRELLELLNGDYEPIPPELRKAARGILRDKQEAYLDQNYKGKLKLLRATRRCKKCGEGLTESNLIKKGDHTCRKCKGMIFGTANSDLDTESIRV